MYVPFLFQLQLWVLADWRGVTILDFGDHLRDAGDEFEHDSVRAGRRGTAVIIIGLWQRTGQSGP